MGRTKQVASPAHVKTSRDCGWATEREATAALRGIEEDDHLAYAVGLSKRLGLFVGKETWARLAAHPTISIGDSHRGLVGLPNKILASVARNMEWGCEHGRLTWNGAANTRWANVLQPWAGDIMLDSPSVEVICTAADGEDHMMSLLYRFSLNSEAWYSYYLESASFLNYNVGNEEPMGSGGVCAVADRFLCTRAEAMAVLRCANEASIAAANQCFEALVAVANDQANLKEVKAAMIRNWSCKNVSAGIAASEHADKRNDMEAALYWSFEVERERRYLADMQKRWSRQTHALAPIELQDAAFVVLLATRVRMPTELVLLVLEHLHWFDFEGL